jgi:flagellar protein FliS
MMYGQNKAAAQYRVVRNHGLVAEASPTRLVQIVFEHIISQLTIARGCMERINDNRPLKEVTAKVTAVSKAMALIGQLNGTLDMERGGDVAQNLRALYVYALNRLTLANATNDPRLAGEVAGLIAEIKSGWDQIVTDAR